MQKISGEYHRRIWNIAPRRHSVATSLAIVSLPVFKVVDVNVRPLLSVLTSASALTNRELLEAASIRDIC